MRFRVTTAHLASIDLVEIRAWQTQSGSGMAARRQLVEIEAALKDLRLHPHRWQTSEHSGLRERPVGRHRIVYRVDDEDRIVHVLRVFSPYQDRTSL